MFGFDFRVEAAEERMFTTERVKVEQVGLERVVEIGRVVGDFIDPIDELRFERRVKVELILGEMRSFRFGVVAGMLDDTFAYLKGEVQTVEGEVAMLKLLDDAKGVEIVIESATVLFHELVELAFAGVTEGGMANIVNERESFGEIRIQAEGIGDSAGDLRNLERVGEAIAKVVGEARGEDLRFRLKAPERTGVDNAIAVACVFAAVRMRWFGKTPAATIFGPQGPRCESAVGFDR